MSAQVRRLANKGPLQDLLIKCCPPTQTKRGKGESQSIPILAAALGMTSAGVYKWIDSGKMSPKRAKKCVELSNGRVTIEEFTPFVYAE